MIYFSPLIKFNMCHCTNLNSIPKFKFHLIFPPLPFSVPYLLHSFLLPLQHYIRHFFLFILYTITLIYLILGSKTGPESCCKRSPKTIRFAQFREGCFLPPLRSLLGSPYLSDLLHDRQYRIDRLC